MYTLSQSASPGTTQNVTTDMAQTTPSKSCGHTCVAGQIEVCCVCMQSLSDITSLLESCEICER